MNSINSLLLLIGLSENEIKTVCERNKEVSSANFDPVFKNLQTLVNAGYPEDELNFIVYNSPMFLTYPLETLEEKIINLKSINLNFAEELKANPNLL